MRGFSQCYIEPACIIGGTFIRPLILWSPKLVRVTYMQFSDCNGSFMKIYKGFRNLCMFWLFIVLDILCLIYCKPRFRNKYFVFVFFCKLLFIWKYKWYKLSYTQRNKFLNLVKLNQIWIAITHFRLNWHQTESCAWI